MGLFSSKKKTVVSVAATTVSLGGGEVNRLREAVIRAIIQKENIADEILETSLNGYSSKLMTAYNWAKDNYYLGLPGGKAEYTDYNEDTIASVLSTLEGSPVTLEAVDVDFQSGEMLVEDHLYNVAGYNPATGVLNQIPIDDVWNAQQRNVVSSEIDAEREAFKAYIETYTAKPEKVDAVSIPFKQEDGTYVFKDGTRTTTQTVTLTVNQNVEWSEAAERQYIDYVMEYGSTDATGAYIQTRDQQELWANATYTIDRVVTETIKTITDDEEWSEEETWTLRSDRYTETSNHYKVSTLDGGYRIDVAPENDELYYAVNYNVDGVAKFWLYKVSAGTYSALNKDAGLEDTSPYFPVVPIRYDNKFYNREDNRDNESYTSANKLLNLMGLDMDYLSEALSANPDIDKIDHAYVVAGVALNTESQAGTRYLAEYFTHLNNLYEPFKPTETSSENTPLRVHTFTIKDGGLNLEFQFSKIETEIKTGKFGAVGKADSKIGTNHEYIRYRVQINATQYREVFVYGLRVINHVYKTYTAITGLADMSDDNEFFVPLHMGVLKSLPLKVRNELYSSSIYMVLNSIQIDVIKLKWYQHGLGKALLTIGTIVIAVYGGYQFAAKLGAAIAAGTAATAAFIATTILVSIVLRFAFKLVVKWVGPEFAMILAVVAMAIGISAEFGSFDIPFADHMLMVANGLSQGIQDNVADMFADLNAEIELSTKELGEVYEALEEANKLLEVSGIIDPYMFVKADTFFDFNEAPTNYYHRTIHAGNVGTLAYDAITNYYDLQLTLPKPAYHFNGVV